MKRSLPALLLILACLAHPVWAQDDSNRPIHVACVGDGITYGTGLPERERWCYPALLQDMLGDGYDVRNFGVEGATLLSAGDRPYVETQAYQDALAFEPDVVVIMLGTNDTKADNWEHNQTGAFSEDYADLIDTFVELESQPRIVVCLPVPAWTQGEGIHGGRVRDGVLPAVRWLDGNMGFHIDLIDLHTPLLDKRAWFPDGVHPNSFGAEAIAKQVYTTVLNGRAPSIPVDDFLAAAGTERGQPFGQFSFHGYDSLRLPFDGVNAMVVRPHVAAQGRPWVWRARFWGHEPQADLAMLERGWHIVYCDAADLYGNPEAVARWDGFYQAMRDAGLGEDLVLEGMSRGGLIVYNWAKANPSLVSAIYGDAPVCDIRSWPGGMGVGQGSTEPGYSVSAGGWTPSDWQRARAAYGLETDDDVANFAGNPIDGLGPLAEHGIPLLHIVGDSDEVVPVSENSDILEARYRALGGDITVIRKPGVGHHPHSLPDPTPIVDFFLEATGRKINFATVARPSVEFRAGAGWGEGNTWWSQHEAINEIGERVRALDDDHQLNVVFLGDSITQSFSSARERLFIGARTSGRLSLFERRFGRFHAANFGIAGDRTEHLLYRIAHGNFDPIDPKVVVLMIGVNNINAAGNTGEETAEGTRAVVAALRAKVPGAHVIVLGCFPTGPQADSPNRLEVDALHEHIADIGDDDEQVTYMDLRPLFLNDDGTLNGNMRGDAIHLTGAGYVAWADAIGPVIRELVED